MRPHKIKPLAGLEGKITLPGDKSIAHRAIIISALSSGLTRVENFPSNKDSLATVRAFQKLGLNITLKTGNRVSVFGRGLSGLKKPNGPISVGDSGTTLRLLLGVLAGQDFETRLIAGKSLSGRPMLRVNKPLRMMGAKIAARRKVQAAVYEEFAPIAIQGGNLKSITYRMPVASAQVKSAILLAGLYAKGKTCVIEPTKTRDHTERMLKLFKARLEVNKNAIVIKGAKDLVSPKRIYVPSDISSASFFMVVASIVPGSEVLIKNVSLNPSRSGIIRVLRRMKANIQVRSQKSGAGSEPFGDIIVKSSRLKGAVVKKEEVPSLIDELPILMVAASLARGRTILEGVGELRVKETDRIRSMSENLKKMGGRLAVSKSGNSERVIIEGVKVLKGARVRSFGDHRTAMSMIVAGSASTGTTWIDDISCINKSFPDFLAILHSLRNPAFCGAP